MKANFVGAYWGPRSESREACAHRIALFLNAVTGEECEFTQWFRKDNSRSTQGVELSDDSILKLLKTNNRDIGGGAIEELGFSFSVWSESSANLRASLAVKCGAVSPKLSNYVVVSFDPSAAPKEELLRGILREAVVAFDPDQAVVTSTEALSSIASLSAWEAPSLFRYTRSIGFAKQ